MDYRLESLRYQLQEDPTSRVFFQLGELLRKEGQLAEAVQILEAGLEHHPRYVAAWVSLGRARHDLGAHERAEAAFAHALEIDPENQVAARLIGEAAISRGDFVRAVKALKLARALSPRDPELDERIAWVEGRLAEEGLLRLSEPPATPPAAAEPFEEDVEEVVFLDADLRADTGADVSAGPAAARPSDRDWPTEPDFEPPPAVDESSDPFVDTDQDPFATRPPANDAAGMVDRAPARPSVVMASSAADPFNLEAMADTGVWIVADDVFGEPVPEVAADVEPAGAAADEDETPFGEAPEVELVAAAEPWAPEPAPAEDEPFGEASAPEAPPLEIGAGPFDAEPSPWEAPSPATTQRLRLSELPIAEPLPEVEEAEGDVPEEAAIVAEESAPLEGGRAAESVTETGADLAAEADPYAAPHDDELPSEFYDFEDDVLPDGETTLRLPPREVEGETGAEPVQVAEEVAISDSAGLEEPAAAMADEGDDAVVATGPAMESTVTAHLERPAEVAAEPMPAPGSQFSDLEPIELGDEEPELEDEPLAEEVPLPTLTLARLALAQGDIDLAERTLQSLLRHHPESSEAARLLADLSARRRLEGPAGAPAPPSAAARISALQGWLDGIRLAAERRTR